MDPGKILKDPDPLCYQFIQVLQADSKVFDLGCGAGRHTIQLALAGFEVIAGDISPVGLELSRKWMAKEGLQAEFLLSEMTDLPFGDGILEGVLSINVLNHGTVAQTDAAFQEVLRVIKPGCPFFFVIIGREDARYGEGDEIEPHTFVHRQGIEAGVPHHYYEKQELECLLAKFSRASFAERRRPYNDSEPVFGNDPRLKNHPDATLQHWAVKAWK